MGREIFLGRNSFWYRNRDEVACRPPAQSQGDDVRDSSPSRTTWNGLGRRPLIPEDLLSTANRCATARGLKIYVWMTHKGAFATRALLQGRFCKGAFARALLTDWALRSLGDNSRSCCKRQQIAFPRVRTSRFLTETRHSQDPGREISRARRVSH